MTIFEGILIALGTILATWLLLGVVLLLPAYLRDVMRGRGDPLRGLSDQALRDRIDSRARRVTLCQESLNEATAELERRQGLGEREP